MDTHSGAIGESFLENLLIKLRNQNIFEKFKINRNLQTISFKIMYNMFMLLSSSVLKWTGGGGGGALNHLPLLFCKSVWYLKWLATLRLYKCTCATPHLHKITNLTEKIVSTDQFTFDCKVLNRCMIRRIVKQEIICFSNMQIRYLKELCQPCLTVPELLLLVNRFESFFDRRTSLKS